MTQMYRWGQISKPVDMKKVAEQVYRPDIFASAAKEVGYKLPATAWKKDGEDKTNKFLDGKVFDPNKAVDYIYGFGVKHVKVKQADLAKINKWSVKTPAVPYNCPAGKPGCMK
jgi:nitrate/nitrite transport system substrate-binding protein